MLDFFKDQQHCRLPTDCLFALWTDWLTNYNRHYRWFDITVTVNINDLKIHPDDLFANLLCRRKTDTDTD